MTTIKLEYGKFERKPSRHQLSNTFQFTIEEVFKTPETSDVEMTAANYSTMIELIVNRNFGNNFHPPNGPNQR